MKKPTHNNVWFNSWSKVLIFLKRKQFIFSTGIISDQAEPHSLQNRCYIKMIVDIQVFRSGGENIVTQHVTQFLIIDRKFVAQSIPIEREKHHSSSSDKSTIR